MPPALLQRDFALVWAASLAMALASQMAAVIIGWQVYGIRQSAFDLGLIGLAGFVPLPLLALPAGTSRTASRAGWCSRSRCCSTWR